MNNSFSLKAENYVSHISLLSTTLLYFDRVHRIDQAMNIIDVFPHAWSLGLGHIEPNQLKVMTDHGEIEVVGSYAMLIPPFCCIEWCLQPGVLEFSAFISISAIPEDIPRQPFLFPFESNELPQSEQEIFQLLREAKNLLYVKTVRRASKSAEQTKLLIDQNYHQRISINNIVKHLKHSHSFVARSFKAAYGLTMVEYRTKLRLFDAMFLLLFKQPKVMTVVYASGFSDPSRFLKQFRQHFRARPSQFRLSKAKVKSSSSRVAPIREKSLIDGR